MAYIHRPSAEALRLFVEKHSSDRLSYEPIGLSAQSPGGFNVDEERTVLGQGRGVFAKARYCLQTWQHFALPWVSVYPPAAPVEPGATVAVVVRYLGLWWLNGCRVVQVFSCEAERWGFSYGTLSAHVESGEESFIVEIEPPEGDVTYSLRAVARPRALVARIGYPLTRALQARFRRDSAGAMKRAIGSGV